MKGFINTLRWFLAIILSLILSIIVLLTPYVLSITTFLTNRENIIELIDATGIYDNLDEVISQVIENKVEEANEGQASTDEVSKTIEENRELFTSILTPSFMRNTVENAVNGVYDYFEGKEEKPLIQLEKESVKEAYFQTLLAAARRNIPELPKDLDLSTLPKCKTSIDKISLDNLCLPKNLDINERFDEFTKDFQGSNDQQSLFIDLSSNSDINFEMVREYFSVAHYLLYIFIGTLLTLTILIAILIPNGGMRFIFPAVIGILPSLLNVILFSVPKAFQDSPLLKIQTYVDIENVNGADMIIKAYEWLVQNLWRNGLIISAVSLASFILLLILGIVVNAIKDRPHISKEMKTSLSKPMGDTTNSTTLK